MQGQSACKSTKLILTAFSLQLALCGRAEFTPVPLTPDSYNQDMVVERTASPPLVPVTTATMEGGLGNTSFTWYERGYRAEFPTSGLPKAGTQRDSEAAADHQYQFAASYKQNNAILIDSLVTNAAFTLVNPAPYVTLSFLVSGGNGGGQVAYTVHHQNGARQTGVFLVWDWFNGPIAAYTAAGRINVDTFAFDMNPGNPRLYANDVALTNTSSPVISIDFAYVTGAGHEAVFAVSGCAGAGELFAPILVSGYNQDLVVEADSTYPSVLAGVTTASMDDGAANAGNTWYERGYYSPAPETGLPPAGTTLVSASAPDHKFTLAASYAGKNVILIDAMNSIANIKPAAPVRVAQLALLTAAGHGPVTNQCVVQHLDGSSQTNRFIAPDWLDSGASAFSANGRIKLSQRLVSTLQANAPSLFSTDIPVVNTVSPMTNLLVSYIGGGLNSHAAIFAVSGSDAAAPPVQPASLSLRPSGDGEWILGSSAPGRLQSTTLLNGGRTVWKDEGQISTTFRIRPAATQTAQYYRVVSP